MNDLDGSTDATRTRFLEALGLAGSIALTINGIFAPNYGLLILGGLGVIISPTLHFRRTRMEGARTPLDRIYRRTLMQFAVFGTVLLIAGILCLTVAVIPVGAGMFLLGSAVSFATLVGTVRHYGKRRRHEGDLTRTDVLRAQAWPLLDDPLIASCLAGRLPADQHPARRPPIRGVGSGHDSAQR